MELHVRTGEGILISVIRGNTAIELKDKLSQSLDFESAFKDYLPLNRRDVLMYKATCTSPIMIGDVNFMFWKRDYIFVVI